MLKVYLAGPIGGLSYEEATNGWRMRATSILSDSRIRVYSPMRYKEALAGTECLDDQKYDRPLTTPPAILARDTYDVRSADILLVNLAGSKRVSIGTMVELGIAHALNKPMVIVNDAVNPVHSGPFIDALSVFRFTDLDEACYACKQILLN